ncbi:hypothetical protein E1211_17790 [Micromonospora sp. 15K316]|uniref:hypothetical protein n=1 Tax=Micromonospora sp. 15K316 TaxID=2530376 RepID=UPI00104D7491|nr:hypothetical protein [Micromonospora sp. 15K316]TDC34200.1 hypothetical protein E1211_17790 [Micromonospora sp. 15K316]
MMTHLPPFPPETEEDRHDHAAQQRAQRLAQLLEERRLGAPPRLYVRATVALAAAAAIDWVAVAYHIGLTAGLDPLIGVHLAVGSTLSVIAVCLGMGWVVMVDKCRREQQRDEIDALRHQDLADLVGWVIEQSRQREWQSYAVGVREGRRQFLDSPTDPTQLGVDSPGVLPFGHRNGSRAQGHR